MPLGERPGDKSESRYCGIETEFNDDMPRLLTNSIYSAGFDFVVAQLVRLVTHILIILMLFLSFLWFISLIR